MRHQRFLDCVELDPGLTRLWTGGRWLEGPAFFPGSGVLIWSDVLNNRMHRRDVDGTITVFRQPANGGNGNTVDRQGRLICCEQNTRRVTRVELDGSITMLADRFGGKRFNSPNDVVVKSDGSIWFTDPDYGEPPDYDGTRELDGCHVYRLDPQSGGLRQMSDNMVMPNGLAFSVRERFLYVIDTGSTHVTGGPNHIRRFAVGKEDILSGGEVIAEDAARCFDGLRVDGDGRLWCGAAEGVRCYDLDGTRLGSILLPERAANLTFGGPGLSQLFICATSSLYRCQLKVAGARTT